MRVWTLITLLGFLLLAACAPRSVWTLPVTPAPLEELENAAPQGRLPGTAKPQTYRVALHLDPRETHFSGSVEIDVKLENAANGLWMHGNGLDVSQVTATSGGRTYEASWTQVLDSGVVWVGFPRRLEAQHVTLAIDYTAPFDTGLVGLFRVESQGHWYALAKSESIQARRFLPSFDEPGLKAVFEVEMTVPEGMHAIGNTLEISREKAGEGYETIRFAPTRPLSSYLLSAAVGNFDKVERVALKANGVRNVDVPLNGYARAGKGPELEYALDLTPAMLTVFEEMLGQPYPYEKMDIIAAPQWPSGATELAAALTYREGRILRGPNAGPEMVRGLKEIHAHEIAHMWFGNLVTPPWWDDLWLKESFATWSETAVLSVMEPEEGHELTAILDGLSAMSLDSLKGARAVAEPIARNQDIRNAYDAITYSKGQAIIRMIDSYFTPEVLRPALGRYIAQYADGEADSEHFYDAIAKASGRQEIGEVFRSFVTQPGVPLVTATPICGMNIAKIELTQSRYRPVGSSIDPSARWTIPVCASWRDGENEGQVCTLLRDETRIVQLDGAICPERVVPNAGGAGYYRFDMPAENWKILTRDFSSLPPAEALVVLDSAEASFNAGRLGAEDLLALLEAGLAHPEGAVITAAMSGWEALLAQLEGTAQADLVRQRAADRFAQVAVPEEDAEADAKLRAFRAIVLRDAEERAGLVQALDAFLSGKEDLSNDLYPAALRTGLEDAGADMFNRVVSAMSDRDDAVFLQAAADALGYVPSAEEASRALDLIYSGAISQQVSYSLAASLMANPQHQDASWARLMSDFPAFTSRVPSQLRRNTPRLARAFCDPAITPELDALFAQAGRDLAGYERALEETKEYLTLCAAQRASARAAFESFLPAEYGEDVPEDLPDVDEAQEDPL